MNNIKESPEKSTKKAIEVFNGVIKDISKVRLDTLKFIDKKKKDVFFNHARLLADMEGDVTEKIQIIDSMPKVTTILEHQEKLAQDALAMFNRAKGRDRQIFEKTYCI